MQDKIEQKRYFCQWKIKSRKCKLPMNVVYEVETKHGAGMCQKHFEQFCIMQEEGKDEQARKKIGLAKRKTPYRLKEKPKDNPPP